MQEIKPTKKPVVIFWIIALIVFLGINVLLYFNLLTRQVKEVGYNTFMRMTENKELEEVNISSTQITFKDYDGHYYKTGPIEDDKLYERLYESGAEFKSTIVRPRNPIYLYLIGLLIWLLVFWAIWHFITKKIKKKLEDGPDMISFGIGDDSGFPGFGGGLGGGLGKKNTGRVYVKSDNGIKFKDVAGEDEAKELLSEIVAYLHEPQKYTDIGATMPKGALLVGPPGTGKTLLARAVAGEANVPFFSISGSEFVQMFVGMGAAKVRDLFAQAKEKAPCIVFIDEIDAIGKKRDASLNTNDEREQTLNQLLSEMDGFEGNTGVVILAATNRPESLDAALLRPGRFDRRIPVELPDLKGRVDILKVHAKKVKIQDNVDFEAIARTASGASGAQLANIVNEAALRAVREGRKVVNQSDLMESVEVVIAGYQKKSRVLSNKEKLVVAYHEVGHALVAALQTHSAPVQKITIIPRTSGALGYTLQVDEDEHFLMTKTELMNQLATLSGGRAAEELIFNEITSGASNDIEKATKIARAMITRFGMSEDFGMVAMETLTNQYLGGDTTLACSPETQTQIDKMVVELVAKQHKLAYDMLQENIQKLHEIAKHLYEHETITGEEFMEILNSEKNTLLEES